MKRYLVLLLFVLNLSGSFAQTKLNYSAMILKLNGDGVIIREDQQAPLRIPLRFYPGDKIQVNNGNATVMLFSGEEVPLSAVSDYIVPTDKYQNSSSLQQMANQDAPEQNLLVQSGKAYQIRGKSGVFPMSTQMIDPENAFILMQYSNIDSLKVEIAIADAFSQKVIAEFEPGKDSILSFSEVEFIKGKEYYWILKGAPHGRPEMGTIVYSLDSQLKPYTELNLKTNYDYLEAISKYYSNKYYYQVYWLLKEALDKFPDVNLYQEMMHNLLRDK